MFDGVGRLVGAGQAQVVTGRAARLPDEGVAVDDRAGDRHEARPRRHDDAVAVLERQVGQRDRAVISGVSSSAMRPFGCDARQPGQLRLRGGVADRRDASPARGSSRRLAASRAACIADSASAGRSRRRGSRAGAPRLLAAETRGRRHRPGREAAGAIEQLLERLAGLQLVDPRRVDLAFEDTSRVCRATGTRMSFWL